MVLLCYGEACNSLLAALIPAIDLIEVEWVRCAVQQEKEHTPTGIVIVNERIEIDCSLTRRSPALFMTVRHETGKTPCETGMRRPEGPRRT